MNKVIAAIAAIAILTACQKTVVERAPPYIPYPDGISYEGKIWSDYGEKRAIGPLKGTTHWGIDIRGHYRQPIHAIADGVVLFKETDACAGPILTIDHGYDLNGERLIAYYVHLGGFLVDSGQHVKRGDLVAYLDRPKRVTQCWRAQHLHLELSDHPYPVRSWWRGPPGKNPHLLWADGPWRPTCFEPGREYPEGTITYPVLCDFQVHTIEDMMAMN